MSLFRSEAVDHRRFAAFGAVTLHVPVSFTALTALVGAAAVGVFLFLGTASYVRKVAVSGVLASEHGMAAVTTRRAGVVQELMVNVGDQVSAGAELAVLNTDIAGVRGGLSELQADKVNERLREIERQRLDHEREGQMEEQRLLERARSAGVDAERLDGLARLQQEQEGLAEQQLRRIEPLVEKGFVSEIERDRRRQATLQQKQAVEDLRRQATGRRAEMQDLTRQATQARLARQAAASELRNQELLLRQGLNELDLEGRVVLRAPISGEVSAIDLHIGDPVTIGATPILLSPSHASLAAEIFLPSDTIGFIEVGAPVTLRIDAFPYQKYGALKGRIVELHKAPMAAAATGAAKPAYRALVRLDKSEVLADGARRPLRVGMTLIAQVGLYRQSFLDALLDPLRAAKRGPDQNS